MTHNFTPEMPCGPILELHGQRKRFHVPYGLKPLIEEMAREALKAQPADLIDFFATFLEARVKRKEEEAEIEKKKGRKSWQVHRWSWEGTSLLTQEDYDEFIRTLPPDKDLNHYATVIQAGFRGFRSRSISKEARKSRDEERRRTSEETERLQAYAYALMESEEEEDGDDEAESLTEFEEDGEGEDDGVVLYEYDEAGFSDKEDTKGSDHKKIPLSDQEEEEEDYQDEMVEYIEPKVEVAEDIQTLPPPSADPSVQLTEVKENPEEPPPEEEEQENA